MENNEKIKVGTLVSDADHLQITRLLTEMVWKTDNGCASEIHQYFTDNGVLFMGEAISGRSELQAWGQSLDQNKPGYYHAVTNVRFIADGPNRAIGTSMLIAFQATKDGVGVTIPVAVGIDHDVLVRNSNGWLLESRRWEPLFMR